MDGRLCDTCANTNSKMLIICDDCIDRANDKIDVLKAQLTAVNAELTTARELIALQEERARDLDERDDDARLVCEWASTVALSSTDVHTAARRYLTGEPSKIATWGAEVQRKATIAALAERDALRAQLATVTAEAELAQLRAERDAAVAEVNGHAWRRTHAERDALRAERDALRAQLNEWRVDNERLRAQLAACVRDNESGREALAAARNEMFAAARERDKLVGEANESRDAMMAERNAYAAETIEIRERIAALEATAADARTCAEWVMASGAYSATWDAARRVLGQLPTRPVVDLDDVRMVCEAARNGFAEYTTISITAVRVLASLGVKP